MAAAENRRLLESLMGEAATYGRVAPQLEITDPKVCKSYLVGNCPHDLFNNTKNDLGACPKQHNEGLKNEWESASEQQKASWNFEWEYKREMERQLSDVDRRIESAQRRLEKTPEEIRQTNNLVKEIQGFAKSIDCLIEEIRVLGELGMVNQVTLEHHKIRLLRQQMEDRKRELQNLSDTGGPSGHQKLQVCDVCGAYLSRLDNDRRLADHFYGKMHLGYASMRKSLEALKPVLRNRVQPQQRDSPYGYGGGRGGYGGGYGGGRGGGGYRGGGRGRGNRF